MNKTCGRARDLIACAAGVAACSVVLSGSAYAATPATASHLGLRSEVDGQQGARLHDAALDRPTAMSRDGVEGHAFSVPTTGSGAGHDGWHRVPGSGTDTDIDHNYHDDLKPESSSNSTSEYSLAQCGSDDDRYVGQTSQCGDTQYRRQHSLRQNRRLERRPYNPDDGYGGTPLGSLF